MTNQYKNLFDELDSGSKSTNSFSKEPNWMMCIASHGSGKFLTASENKGEAGTSKYKLEHYAYVLDHQFCLTRGFSTESASKALMPDGGLTAHELKIITSIGSVSPGIHTAFSQNIMIPQIHLIRVVMVTNTHQTKLPYHVTAEYVFNEAYISGLISKNDVICLGFRYAGIHYTKQSFDPTTGTTSGNEGGAYHDLVTGHSSTGSAHPKIKPHGAGS